MHSQPVSATEQLFARYFQIFHHALQYIKNYPVLLDGNTLHRSSSHVTLQLEDSFAFGLAHIGQHHCCSITSATFSLSLFLLHRCFQKESEDNGYATHNKTYKVERGLTQEHCHQVGNKRDHETEHDIQA